jgi:hypothetical protein
MKTITNTIIRGGGRGFNSLGVASRERNNTKGGSRTRGKTPIGSKPPRKRPSTTQQRKRGGFNPLGATLRERNSTKGSSRPLENNH